MDLGSELWLMLWAWLLLAGASGAGCLILWWLLPGRGQPLWPRPRQRLAPWSGAELVLIFLAQILWVGVSNDALLHLLGPPDEAGRSLRELLTYLLAAPFFLVTILLLVRRISDTRWYHLGLSCHRAGPDVLLGYLSWLIFGPALYALHGGVEWTFRWFHLDFERHLLERLLRGVNPPLEWTLIVISAVVVAPLLEELLFRRLLLGWLMKSLWHSQLFAAVLLVVAQLNLVVEVFPELQPWLQPNPQRAWAAGFLLVMLLLYALAMLLPWRSTQRRQRFCALYVAALVFAILHPWPTSIALFVLGWLLGLLAQRTQTLWPCVVLHILFNGASCLVLALK